MKETEIAGLGKVELFVGCVSVNCLNFASASSRDLYFFSKRTNI